MESILPIISHIFSLGTLGLTIFGTLLGIVLGAAPGLNGPIGVALLLPLTYGLDPADGLLMLGGIYMGSTYGGSIASILLNCPGTGEASCTALDGYPMAKQGHPRAALLYSINASTFGGFIGTLALLFLTPVLANIALKFGPPEMLIVAIAGLSIVGGLSGSGLAKAMFAVTFGVLISLVGPDITGGGYNFTFGIRDMRGGIGLIPLVVGFFAVTEMLSMIKAQEETVTEIQNDEKISLLTSILNMCSHWYILIKSTLLGVAIGILPGTGGAVSAFVAYGEAKRSSPEKDKFGQGAMDGIIAPEAANNAAVGGSLVPLLALGIPGSATAAIIYGALTIHSLIPGPNLLKDSAEIAYTFMGGMVVTVFIMFICGVLGVKLFAKVLRVPAIYLISTVLVFTTIGVYSMRNSIFDLVLTFVFGLLGLLFRKISIPPAPILLGSILGPLIIDNLSRCLVIAKAQGSNIFYFMLTRPFSAVLLVALIAIVLSNIKVKKKA